MASAPAARSSGAEIAATARNVERRGLAGFLGKAQERVAAERDADREQRPGMGGAEATEHPADLFVVAGVVGARREIDLAGTAAEMGDGEAPAPLRRLGGEGLRVVAPRRALQAVEKHEQRRRAGGVAEPVDIDEVAIRRRPALAAKGRRRSVEAAAEERRPDRLQMSARQPARGGEVVHQCRVEAASAISSISVAVPGLA